MRMVFLLLFAFLLKLTKAIIENISIGNRVQDCESATTFLVERFVLKVKTIKLIQLNFVVDLKVSLSIRKHVPFV